MSTNKFIPFEKINQNTSTEPTQKTSDVKIELKNLSIDILVNSSQLLLNINNYDEKAIIEIALTLKNKLESILEKIPAEKITSPTSDYVSYTGTTSFNEFKTLSIKEYPDYVSKIIEKNSNRQLDNGGMAPPKEWKSITELNLKDSEKNSLIEQMRALKEKGLTIKSNFHHKNPIVMEEFTEPFKYLENMHDYNGSFLITLLRSKIEISNQESTFQIDLQQDKDMCEKCEGIILSVYDISGSASSGEEKKFLLILKFDNLSGSLTYSHPIFMNGKKYQFSTRQLSEINKLCKAKKINN